MKYAKFGLIGLWQRKNWIGKNCIECWEREKNKEGGKEGKGRNGRDSV